MEEGETEKKLLPFLRLRAGVIELLVDLVEGPFNVGFEPSWRLSGEL